jgi:hypothetical protein
MRQIALNDQILQAALRGAADGGYRSVEEYIADLILADRAGAEEEGPAVNHLFTAELLARLDQISTEVKADQKTFTLQQMRELVAGKRQG